MQIDQKEYDSLIECRNKLIALERAGVNNWDGWDTAMEFLNERKAFEHNVQLLLDEVMEWLSGGVEEPAGTGCGFGFSGKAQDGAYKVLLRHVKELK